jgi:hypothetical protein
LLENVQNIPGKLKNGFLTPGSAGKIKEKLSTRNTVLETGILLENVQNMPLKTLMRHRKKVHFDMALITFSSSLILNSGHFLRAILLFLVAGIILDSE